MAGLGRAFVVAWHEEDTEEALRAAYRAERDVDVRQRLHALWLLRSGKRRMDEVVGLVGTTYRTVQRWVAWYRAGGLEAIRTHRMVGTLYLGTSTHVHPWDGLWEGRNEP